MRDKNNITRFFMTSTFGRKYSEIIECAEKLKKENFKFEIIVTGRAKTLNLDNIPHNLTDSFIFKHEASYSELYKSVESSDYIILPLYPDLNYDREYLSFKISGSLQLIYGFLKPAIINKEFGKFYCLDNTNSLIYNNNNFYNIIKKSILLNKSEYKILQSNLKKTEKQKYDLSISNIKKSIKNNE